VNDGEVEWGVAGGDVRRMGTNARERWTEERGVWGGRRESTREVRKTGEWGEEEGRSRARARGRGVCNAGFASRSSEGELRVHLQDGARVGTHGRG
jgi:hypothetical protein